VPELPEIVCRAREMNEALVGRAIRSIEVLQRWYHIEFDLSALLPD